MALGTALELSVVCIIKFIYCTIQKGVSVTLSPAMLEFLWNNWIRVLGAMILSAVCIIIALDICFLIFRKGVNDEKGSESE